MTILSRRTLAALMLVATALAAPAQALEEITWDPNDRDLRALKMMEELFPEATGDIVPWTIIGLSKELAVQKGADVVVKPAYDKQVLALDGKVIKVKGFMLPLEPSDKQGRFILSPLPVDCSFCLPAGPNLMIQVEAKTPIAYTWDVMVVSGRLALLPESEDGLFYKLLDSVEVATH